MIRVPSLFVAVSLVLSTAAAQAQEATAPPPAPAAPVAPPPPPEPAASPPPPAASAPASPEPGTPAALAPTSPPAPPDVAASPRMPKAFLEQFIQYDVITDKAYVGSQRRSLTPTELFTLLERPDLIAKSEAASRQRNIFFVSAGAIAVVGAVTAAVAWASLPDLNQSFCVSNASNFNDICVKEYREKILIGTVGLIGGLAGGALLATLGYWSKPTVLSPDETLNLTSQHNAALLQRLRQAAPPSGGNALRLNVTPYFTPEGGGLLTSMRF